MTWSSFRNLKSYPDNTGWGAYLDSSKGVVTQDPQSKARGVFSSVTGSLRYDGAYDGPTEFPSTALNGTGMKCGLVVQHEQDSAVVRISCRATKLPGALLSMPMFYTEVRFQGIPYK